MLAPAPRSRIKRHALIGATRTANIHNVNIYQARVHITLAEVTAYVPCFVCGFNQSGRYIFSQKYASLSFFPRERMDMFYDERFNKMRTIQLYNTYFDIRHNDIKELWQALPRFLELNSRVRVKYERNNFRGRGGGMSFLQISVCIPTGRVKSNTLRQTPANQLTFSQR